MLLGITRGSLAALLLNLLAIRALRDLWEVDPHPSAGAMYWVCLLLPLLAGVVVGTVIGLLHRPNRPIAIAFLTTYAILGTGMVVLQNFLDTFADHM